MNTRIDYIDVLKGIGILFVIIGHMYTVPECKAYVYSFHLPLFFIISGALLNESKYTSFKEFFISRFKSLFFPFAGMLRSAIVQPSRRRGGRTACKRDHL